MRKIAVLDQHTIDQIAAGEVVERPASVVKELVENSIDAGATAVTVEISDGGRKLIRITDNGSGMDYDQIPLAFLRHATSKIKKIEDLEQIASLGFRGEALSSIAAVSQVELITKTPTAVSGARYVIEGGREMALEELGAPEGTTFLVRNLFYNTPARSKFLKSDVTEGNYISELMEHLALSHPEVSFKYIQNKQVKLHTTGNYSVKDVIYHIYGRDITKNLLEVSFENDFMKISGFAGKPEISRGNRSFENYYVNGRFVKNNIITKAIEDAYKGFLMQRKFPFVSLHIFMSGNDLDVNVHPAKREVRFARGPEVYDAVFDTVRHALTGREMIPRVTVGKEESFPKREVLKRGEIPEPFETKRLASEYAVPADALSREIREERAKLRDMNSAQILTPEEENWFQGSLSAVKQETVPHTETMEKPVETEKILPKPEEKEPPEKQLELFEEKLLAPESRIRHQLIGQIFDTYWLVQFGDSFFIIDQHAAHEKIYYERLVKQFRDQEVISQFISPPLIVTLNIQEEALLASHQEYFQKFGFEIEHFGGREYSISAVPAMLYGLTEEGLFLEMLDQLGGDEKKDSLEFFASRLAGMACKAAVKGNHKMSVREAEELIDELLTLENPYHCPHGRPTIISMSKSELEKKFKRIV